METWAAGSLISGHVASWGKQVAAPWEGLWSSTMELLPCWGRFHADLLEVCGSRSCCTVLPWSRIWSRSLTCHFKSVCFSLLGKTVQQFPLHPAHEAQGSSNQMARTLTRWRRSRTVNGTNRAVSTSSKELCDTRSLWTWTADTPGLQPLSGVWGSASCLMWSVHLLCVKALSVYVTLVV